MWSSKEYIHGSLKKKLLFSILNIIHLTMKFHHAVQALKNTLKGKICISDQSLEICTISGYAIGRLS